MKKITEYNVALFFKHPLTCTGNGNEKHTTTLLTAGNHINIADGTDFHF